MPKNLIEFNINLLIKKYKKIHRDEILKNDEYNTMKNRFLKDNEKNIKMINESRKNIYK